MEVNKSKYLHNINVLLKILLKFLTFLTYRTNLKKVCRSTNFTFEGPISKILTRWST